MSSSRPKALVVSHDAGGAEVASAWVRDNQDYEFSFCLKGAAEKIFARKMDISHNLSEEEAKRRVHQKEFAKIFTGTSWEDFLELRMIKHAKKCETPTATFLDHWVNHRQRFGYPKEDWRANLPDEVYCGDEYCLDICKEWDFPSEKLKLVPNKYFDEIKQDALSLKVEPQKNSILYLCEPIADHTLKEFGDELYLGYNEYTAIDNFLQGLKDLSKKPDQITIRQHPSEPLNKYDKNIAPFLSDYKIKYSQGTGLTEDLMSHETIVGCETMAMVVGILVGKDVFTAIPKEAKKPCSLPFKEIKSFF